MSTIVSDAEIIEIDENQARDAKILAANLSTEQTRKRGMIDFLGIGCAMNYLYSKRIRVTNSKSVYKIPFLFEEFKISDIYFGNYRIDVITLYKEKTVKIPKIHVDMDVLPHFYFVIQIGTKIREAKIIGFINSKHILSCSHDSKYYYPTLDLIVNADKFLYLTRHTIPSKTLLGKHIDCLGLFLKFIDEDLSSVYKRQLIQHLMNCDGCRARFIDAMEFEKLSNNLRFYPDLVQKYEKNKNFDIDEVQKVPKKEEISLEEAIGKDESENKIKEYFKETNTIYKDESEEIEKIYSNEPNEALKELKTVQMFDLPKKRNNNVTTKVIETIFNEMPKFELPALKTIMQAKNKRMVLTVSTIILILFSFILISFNSVNDAVMENKQMAQYEEYNNSDGGEFGYGLEYDLGESNGRARLIPKGNGNMDDYTIKQPVINGPSYSPNVTKVAWEAPESLAKDNAFAKYLQLTGKNIKLNLQNDLLLVTDVPVNKTARLEIKFNPLGNIENFKFIQSSGSNIIDQTIRKIVIDTVTYMKPPVGGLVGKDIKVNLNIELL